MQYGRCCCVQSLKTLPNGQTEVRHMNLPDSFYIALCMTVLLVGAVYWVWTQIQYVQRKVNVLENIVYELKTLCSARPPSPDLYDMPSTPVMINTNTPAPYTDIDTTSSLLHQTLRQEIEMLQKQQQEQQVQQVQQDHQVHEQQDHQVHEQQEQQEQDHQVQDHQVQEQQEQQENGEQGPAMFVMEHADSADDLQPGGVGSGLVDAASALESMTLKELKRLAQQRGVVGYSEMKKREIITALRAMPSDGFSEM
jgi:Rho termination factor, N-terminal domain